MQEKTTLNLDELANYSKAFAKKLTDYFFINRSQIEGKDILKFCDIQQVNLLIVKNLFQKWQEETAKIKSPYFDYSNAEVQNSLKNLMNVLSHHIQLQKNDFQNLLQEAILDTLLLILNPRDFFIAEFKKPAYSIISQDKIKETQKYLQYNRGLLKAFTDEITARGLNELTSTEAILIFEQSYRDNQRYIEPMAEVVRRFSDIYPLDMNKVFLQNPVSIQQNVAEKALEYSKDNSMDEEAMVDQPNTLNSRLKNEAESKASILDKFQQAKIENIRTAISLNQKFAFINKLFKGNSLIFNEAVDRIEECGNFNEARQLINREYALKLDWDFENEDVKSFFELVERRFD